MKDYLAPASGNCPVQSKGIVNGCPYYFRARHDHCVFSAAPVFGDPVEVHIGRQLGWRLEWYSFNSGWMNHDDADRVIAACAELFRVAVNPWAEAEVSR